VAIQQLAVEIEKYPENMVLLDKYIETLGKYIDSGLLEEHLLRNLRIVYNEALDKKLARVKNDKQALTRKLGNSIELSEYASAFEISDLLKKYWPEDEKTWINALRVCVEGKDANRLYETLEVIKLINIDWTKPGKEQVDIWMKGVML
jgi:hypothetical protein